MSTTPNLEAAVRQLGGDPADLPFWNACRDGRFLLHRCGVCCQHYWPASRCVAHGDAQMAWVDSGGAGSLHTYTVMHHAYTPAMKQRLPYIVGVIQLDEGPFFHSNVIDCLPQQLQIGMRLQAEMASHESGLTVPVFRPITPG